MTLIAKTIVRDQLWVITDGSKKIGNIEIDNYGYCIKIGDNTRHFASTNVIEQTLHVTFDKPTTLESHEEIPFAYWPVDGETFNNFYDVKRKLHVFTKTKNSLCYHCAGYYNIKMDNEWETIFCPKYIFIQRYPYQGPFKTVQETITE